MRKEESRAHSRVCRETCHRHHCIIGVAERTIYRKSSCHARHVTFNHPTPWPESALEDWITNPDHLESSPVHPNSMAMELCSKVLGHAARVKFPDDQAPWSAVSRLLRMAIMSMSIRMPARLKSLPRFHSPWPSASSESPCENSLSRFFLSKWAKRSSFTLQSLDNISWISSSFAPALWFASSVSICLIIFSHSIRLTLTVSSEELQRCACGSSALKLTLVCWY